MRLATAAGFRSLLPRTIAAVAVALVSLPAKADHAGALRFAMSIEKKKAAAKPNPSGVITGAAKTDESAAAPAQFDTLNMAVPGLRAQMKVIRGGGDRPAGSSAFAEITITSEAAARYADAELLLRPTGGEIRAVTGGAVELSGEGDERVARVTKLRKGKQRTVIVEMRLDGGTPGAGPARSALEVSLRAPGKPESDTRRVGWTVSDCSGGFHAELAAIRDANADRMGEVLKAARTRDRTRPGRWLFRPPAARRTSRRVCVGWRRHWDARRGRTRPVCVRWQRKPVASETAGINKPVTKEEREIYRAAARLVRTRAIDPELSVQRNAGWVSHRVSTDLRGFLRQEPHPAICSGAKEMVDFFAMRMDDVRARGDDYAALAVNARQLAAERVDAAYEAVEADAGGHPGWGAGPLLTGATALDGTERLLEELTARLATLAGEEALGQEIADAENAFAALKAMRGYLSGAGRKALSSDIRTAFAHALSLIEAADYIGTVAGHYASLNRTILGSLSALRASHERHCTCGG